MVPCSAGRPLNRPMGGFWTLPGYGDHLEERNPGLRQQMGQMGAPGGFIDVVAAFNPYREGRPRVRRPTGTLPFAADDVVATAAKVKGAWRRGS